jgi:hypothetical protein
MQSFNITSEELAEALDITVERLFEICDDFDSDPNDDWELIKDFHFRWGPYRTRIFSSEGAVEICNYLEENKRERSFIKRWKRWLLQRDQKLKGLMVAKRIQELSALEKEEIIFQSGRAFFSPKACREVLGLGKRQDLLKQSLVELLKSKDRKEVPRIGVDFIEIAKQEILEDMTISDLRRLCSEKCIKWRNIDGQGKNLKRHEMIDKIYGVINQESYVFKNHFLSGSGLASISKSLGLQLTQKHRKAWMQAVSEYAPKAIETIEKYEAERGVRISKAKDRVRKQASGHCQITNRRQSIDKFDLEVHHLYDQKHYPQFADVEINLIAIASDIHTHFHQWMGGSHISCTVEDMEKYIAEFSNHLFSGDNIEQATRVAIRLDQAKKVLRIHQ